MRFSLAILRASVCRALANCFAGALVLGQALYFRAHNLKGTQQLISQYTDHGIRIRQFGRPYLSDQDVAQAHLSNGPMACDESSDVVATMLAIEPYVYAYKSNGTLRWISKIDDFVSHHASHSVHISRRRQQIVFTRDYPVGSDMPIGIVRLQPATLLVQIARVITTAEGVPPQARLKLRSYIIDAKTGAGLYVSDTLPRVVAAGPGLFYSLEATPRWSLMLYRY